jgi:hypothetical protein
LASYQQLQDDICGWANRQDIRAMIPGIVAMVETEIAETLRARCMVTSGVQPIDSPYITLPVHFAAMESIRDNTTGEMFDLKDQWSGSWVSAYMPNAWNVYSQLNTTAPCTAYRLLHDCIEFLPHPVIPDPPDPSWVPQQVLMGWYARPKPLVLPADTNTVLENLYAVYLWGVLKNAAMFELDDDRAAQADAQWQQVITRANLWKQQSDYSGAPYREEMAVRF